MIFFILLSNQSVWADPQDEIDPDQAAEWVASGFIISLDKLFEMHEFLNTSRLLDLELEQEPGEPIIYEIEVLLKNGYVGEYEIDAKTGVLLQESFNE
ncbi:PepSY domain-containing protein [Amphritea balenae]|uniref:Peptidase M4 n=1 Tax=Amphritea balenae TaxID=452629 RepID=A0A3P1SQX3_9GAMM|nr:peptidase M4 [Amphritea balenae]RRC99576.1 peptidase M4 [Amphritea balenae]